jgi:NAD(P)H-quinone oxidoreductase subunit 5
MVAAGVFLVARLQPVYLPFPQVQLFIAVIGTITLVLGASIALTQMDLKKGLAYSTVSQLGYMMLAMGCGAPVAGMFHLVTHAFFKAMLFLGSGSVIHAMEEVVGHEPVLAQDMRLMGGLRRWMPVTSTTFFIGCLAISGIPPLAGFWSKDEILGQAFGSFPLLWVAGFLTAGMTAFYMFRLYFLTFEGEFRGNDSALQAQLLAAAGKATATAMPSIPMNRAGRWPCPWRCWRCPRCWWGSWECPGTAASASCSIPMRPPRWRSTSAGANSYRWPAPR